MAVDKPRTTTIIKLSQQHAYTTIQMHEAVGRRAGLAGTDHKYLGFLLQKGQMTAGELAASTGLTTGAVTGLIDRLEKKKLVKRRFAPDDRRKVFVEPNNKRIMTLLEPLYRGFRRKSQKLMASLSPSEIKTIEKYFVEAIKIMNETTHKLQS